jgi:hypothetical protein
MALISIRRMKEERRRLHDELETWAENVRQYVDGVMEIKSLMKR